MRHVQISSTGKTSRIALRCLALALLTALPIAAHASDDGSGRSDEDRAMENFLLHAEIVKIEDVGEGITKPRRVTLTQGNLRHRAIFKTIDQKIQGEVFTKRLEKDFSDKYTYEVAAYRLDRLAGLGLVPVTVLRTINGEAGSLQLWIENVITFEEAVQDENAEIENFDLLVERLGLMYILDALIYNVDRNFGNILVNLDEDRFYPIDHSRAFRLSRKPLESTRGKTDKLAIPTEVERRLRAIDIETLDNRIGELLEENQVKAILERRNKLLKTFEKQRKLSDSSGVGLR